MPSPSPATGAPRRSPLQAALRGAFLALALGAVPAAALAQNTPAAASPAARDFRIPAGPLADAVDLFARQAGISVAYDAAALAGLKSGGLQGRHGVAAGLDALLAGSGLHAVPAAGGYTLKKRPPAAAQGEAVLPLVRVQAAVEAEVYRAAVANSATRINAPLRDVPQTVDVVTASLFEDQAARSMQDVLRNVPAVSAHIGDGQRDQFYIRGFDAIGDLYIDGLRDDALYYRDLANIERVEVVKGPAAVLYGRGSSGGIVNRIGKKPVDTPLAEVGLTVGSNDQKRATFDVGNRLNDLASFRVAGALEQSGSFREHGFVERNLVAPSLALRLAPDTQLLFQMDHLKDTRITDTGIPAFRGRPADVPLRTYYGTDNPRRDDYSTSEVTSGRIRLEHRFNADFSLSNHFGVYDYRLDRQQTFATAVSAAGMATLLHGNVRRQDEGWFNQLELSQNLTTGDIKHQFLYGLELGEQKKDFQSSNWSIRPTVSLFNPVRLNLAAFGKPVLANDNLSTLKVQSLYVQDLVSFSRYWKALVGVRHDSFRQQVDDRLAADRERTDREWSPRAGLVFQPDAWQSYYLSYSQSFQPSGETLAFTAAQAQMAPEETRNVEIGAKYELFDGKAAATAALFDLERSNIKSVVPGTSTILPVGKQRTRGLELTLSGEIARGWQLAAGYAYQDARIVDSVAVNNGVAIVGKRAALTPLHSANLWLLRELGGGFKAGGGLNYAGDRYAAPDNLVNLGDYLTVDAAIIYESKSWDLALNLKNLADEKYFASGHGASNNLNAPGAPRTVELAAKFRF